MRTRAEHLEWCKQRAREYLEKGDATNAVTSMMSDIQKHPETEVRGILALLGVQTAANGDLEGARRYIEGFR